MKSINADIQPSSDVDRTHSRVVDLRTKTEMATDNPAPAAARSPRRPGNTAPDSAFFEAIPAATPTAPFLQPKAEPVAKPLAAKDRSLLKYIVKAVVLLIAAIIFLSLNIALPERLIGIYFAASIIYTINSQVTFLVALIFLVLVAIWSSVGNDVTAQDYAVYAFYFLVIGLLAALRETVWPKTRFTNQPTKPAAQDDKHLQLSGKI
jgi:hypothetical protein